LEARLVLAVYATRPDRADVTLTVVFRMLQSPSDDGHHEQREATPPNLCAEIKAGLLCTDARCTDMQMVEADLESVETRPQAGQIARCWSCRRDR